MAQGCCFGSARVRLAGARLGAPGGPHGTRGDHRRTMRRVVVVGNKAWPGAGDKLVSQFVEAETVFFDAG